MRPLSYFLIAIGLAFGLNHYLSLRQANNAMHQVSIVQAYHYAVQLAKRNEVREAIHLSDPLSNRPPPAAELEATGIKQLSYEPGGAIRIVLDARSGRDGGVIVYLPLMENGNIVRWTCVTPDYPGIAKFLPDCRYME